MFWILLGGIAEVFWLIGLKHSFDNPWGIVATIFALFISFNSLILGCKKMPTSIAYTLFVGIGSVLVIGSEIVLFKANVSYLKIALIILLVLGVIGLKLSSDAKEGEGR